MKQTYVKQYPLKQHTGDGLANKAEIFIETWSDCNAPVLPLKKTHPNDYLLLHDLGKCKLRV